jgi:4-hydroxyphenylpyruvate dioxygenase
MQLSIATVCLSGGLEEKLHAIAAAGFTGVEIFENDLLSFNGTPGDVREIARGLGLELVVRRGGYKGFGASNAQIRLAVQSREARQQAIPRR